MNWKQWPWTKPVFAVNIPADWFSGFTDADRKTLGEILTAVQSLQAQGKTILMDLTALTTEVGNNTTVTQSVVALVNNLAAQIAAASGNQTQLNALVATLQANDAAIAAAVTANTPTPAGS
jgi:hypothetical protein